GAGPPGPPRPPRACRRGRRPRRQRPGAGEPRPQAPVTFAGDATVQINATPLQPRRAYQSHFGTPMPAGMSFSEAARRLAEALRTPAATRLVEAQSNAPRQSLKDR